MVEYIVKNSFKIIKIMDLEYLNMKIYKFGYKFFNLGENKY